MPLDRNNVLHQRVVEIYANWLRLMAPDSYDETLESDLWRCSPGEIGDPHNLEYAVFDLDCDDDGGPAKVYVDLDRNGDDDDIHVVFQVFDGQGSIIFQHEGPNRPPKYAPYPTPSGVMPGHDVLRFMSRLLKRVDELMHDGETDHWEICNNLATHFSLYDALGHFPIWLSRVVEGRMRDFGTSEQLVD